MEEQIEELKAKQNGMISPSVLDEKEKIIAEKQSSIDQFGVDLETWKQRAQKCRDDRTQVVKEKKESEARLTQSLASVSAELDAARRDVVELYAKIKSLEEEKGSESSSGVLVSSTGDLKESKDVDGDGGWGDEDGGWGEDE
jgi:DNA repair exonuclease SbcCD ATPase subunit